MTTRHAYPQQVDAFKAQWPCHGLPDALSLEAEFADNGDLVDLRAWVGQTETDTNEFDGPALTALVNDMQNFALKPFMSARDLRAELALTADDGDQWGWCMGWWFAIAGEMNDRGESVPDDWQYRPSPFGGRDPDTYETDICAAATTEALQQVGALLHRYAARLKHAGLDY